MIMFNYILTERFTQIPIYVYVIFIFGGIFAFFWNRKNKKNK
jgi:hypothetical protein